MFYKQALNLQMTINKISEKIASETINFPKGVHLLSHGSEGSILGNTKL